MAHHPQTHQPPARLPQDLANRTGQTFTYPQTSHHASAEINRLKHAQPSSRTERYVERKLIADQIATGPLDAARVREDEISGRGSSATWMHNREQDPPPIQDPGPGSSRRRRAPSSVSGPSSPATPSAKANGSSTASGSTGSSASPTAPPAAGSPRLPGRARARNQERARRPDRRLPPTGRQARPPAPGRLPAARTTRRTTHEPPQAAHPPRASRRR